MKKYVSTGKNDGRWQYGEKEVVLYGTDKVYTLTQPKKLFNEDYYTVTRAVACANFECKLSEDNLSVYEVSYLENGGCSVITVEEDVMLNLLKSNEQAFLSGHALDCIKDYFDAYNKAVSAGAPYKVEIVEILARVVEYPDAKSWEEAIHQADCDWHSEQIVLCAEDLKAVEFSSYID